MMLTHNHQKLLTAMILDGYLDFQTGHLRIVEWKHGTLCNFWAGFGDKICDCSPSLTLDGKRIKIPYKYKRELKTRGVTQ